MSFECDIYVCFFALGVGVGVVIVFAIISHIDASYLNQYYKERQRRFNADKKIKDLEGVLESLTATEIKDPYRITSRSNE